MLTLCCVVACSNEQRKGLNLSFFGIPSVIRNEGTYSTCFIKKVIYRNYKNWSQLQFEDEMRRKLTSSHPSVYRNLESNFVNALETNTPPKLGLLGLIISRMLFKSCGELCPEDRG